MAKFVRLKNNLAVVRVERVFRHPRYQKTIKRHKDYLVRIAPELKGKGLPLGQLVEIVPSAPTSARSYFRLVKIYD